MLPAEKLRSFEGFGPVPQGDRGGSPQGDARDLACLTTCAPDPASVPAAEPPQPSASTDGRSLGDVVAGRYRIEAPLGHGAMGAVYRGTRMADGAAVAIKLMHARLTRDDSVARRFDREVAVATRLDHRNCVRVFEGGTTDDGTKFLVMPLLHGVELRQRLRGPMPAPWVVDIVGQVLAGLDHAHRLGFVHRDVKPENVFVVQAEDGSDIAQLLDFGLVKLLDPVSGGVPLTREGLVFGTPAYMSPEQAAGQRIDARADLYGVGVMMYEMLAGAPPFQADEAVVLLRRQMLADPPALPSHVPPALAAFVLRLLEKNPRDRFASATEALAALAEAAAGRAPSRSLPVPSRSPSPAELSWHAAAREPSRRSATSAVDESWYVGERSPSHDLLAARSWHAGTRHASWSSSASLIRSTTSEQRAFTIMAVLLAVLAGGLWAFFQSGSDELATDPASLHATAGSTGGDATAPATDPAADPAASVPTDVAPAPSEPVSTEPAPPAPAPASSEPVSSEPVSSEPEPEPATTEPATTEPAEPPPAKAEPKAKPKAKPKAEPKAKPTPKPSARPRAPRATPTPTPEPEPTDTRVLRTDRPPRTPSKASKLPGASTHEPKVRARRLTPRTS